MPEKFASGAKSPFVSKALRRDRFTEGCAIGSSVSLKMGLLSVQGSPQGGVVQYAANVEDVCRSGLLIGSWVTAKSLTMARIESRSRS